MALIKCPECKREISDKAQTCIHCGYPLKGIPTSSNQLKKVVLYSRVGYVVIKDNLSLDEATALKNKYEQIGEKPIILDADTDTKKSFDDWKSTPTCPRCGSTSITTGARGVNHFWGFIGASKTVNRCAKCGHMWEPKR